MLMIRWKKNWYVPSSKRYQSITNHIKHDENLSAVTMHDQYNFIKIVEQKRRG